MSDNRLLVTGATGFTGRYLLEAALLAGYDCHGTYLESAENMVAGARYHSCDLTDVAATAELAAQVQPNYVAHLAGIAFVAHGSARDVYDSNLWGTVNLLNALAAHAPAVRKVLVASSANIYGEAMRMPIPESCAPAPVNDYGVSKFAMEQACRIRQGALPLVVVRPFNYTGVGQSERFLIPKIVAAFRAGQHSLELGNLDVARDFSDVRDVVAAYLSLLAEDTAGQAFNICCGTPTSLRAVVAMLEDMAGYAMDVQVNPAFVRAQEIRELYGDASALNAVMGDWPRIPLHDTLSWMLTSKPPTQ